MKKLVLGALALAALLPAVSFAQESQRTLTLAYAWDMDGEAADADQVMTATNLVDNGTSVGGANYTITAQPDSCRLIDLTVVDADSSLTAGAITIVGTGCLGEAKSCSFTFAAGGSGVKTLTCADGDGAYFGSIATITTGALTGEAAGDTGAVGYTSNSVNARAMYGRLGATGSDGSRWVDPFGSYAIGLPITTSGALTTTVTSVSSNGAFTNVAVGDLLLINVGGIPYERKVTARASANSVTVNAAINIPATGVRFNYKKFWVSTNPKDLLLIPVKGFNTITFYYDVAANANTGGVILDFSCTQEGPGFPSEKWFTPTGYTTPLPVTIASGSTGYAAYVHDISNDGGAPADYCQVLAKFGTGDDADVAAEDIDLTVVLAR